MKYSIVIPTYNHLEDCLKPCIESIKTYTDLSTVEIIIVANGCSDGTKEYAESLGEPFKLLWFDEPIGYTKATNEGIKVAQGEFVIFLNNDTVLLWQTKNQWLDMLEEPFSEPLTGVSGPLVYPVHYAPKYSFTVFFCAMTRKKMFNELGLLDEIFSPGFGEDMDFCCKAIDKGYKIVQVPLGKLEQGGKFMVGQFPIYHAAEATFNEEEKWAHIKKRNDDVLKERYGKAENTRTF